MKGCRIYHCYCLTSQPPGLGSGHDNAVKDLGKSYLQNLQTQEESTVPSYIEQSRSYTVEVDEADKQDSEEYSEFQVVTIATVVRLMTALMMEVSRFFSIYHLTKS